MARTINTWLYLLTYLCLCCLIPVRCAGLFRKLHDKVILECPFREKDLGVDLNKVMMRWDHDGRILAEYRAGEDNITISDPRVKMSMEELGQGKAPINLFNLTLTDSGKYTCLVQYGNQVVPFQYRVQVKERGIEVQHISSGSRKQIALNPAPLTSRLSKHHSSLHVPNVSCIAAKPGASVTLNCSFQSPSPVRLDQSTIKWTKNGVVMQYQNNSCCGSLYPEIYFEDSLVKLELINVTLEDAGNYNCYIKHESTEQSYDIILQVTENSACSDFSDPVPRNESRKQHGGPTDLQIGLVTGAALLTAVLAVLLYFCYKP
ncbi:uncharacterized protein LOC134571044 [Pelobates fuscus]|uniref:uncharacterized protein LOC134571044 n=1 Tax=Pelobates fuscus TaxID=191477 RepID=UPI002FE4F334